MVSLLGTGPAASSAGARDVPCSFSGPTLALGEGTTASCHPANCALPTQQFASTAPSQDTSWLHNAESDLIPPHQLAEPESPYLLPCNDLPEGSRLL